MSHRVDNLREVISLWTEVNPVSLPDTDNLPNISDIIASVFAPGPCYYYIFNFFNHQFEYVHPNIREVLGYEPEDFDLDFWFTIMDADDVQRMKRKEAAASEFLFKTIPFEKITDYKVSYSFRLKTKDHKTKMILHQVITLVTQGDKIHYVLGVHSDITHLKTLPEDRISFIGLNGAPSYFSLSTDPETLLQPPAKLNLSEREKEIISRLAAGHASKEIAIQLHISNHTVDTHRRNLLKKVGVQNTQELVAVCLKLGLI